VSSRNYTLGSKAPFNGLGEPSSGCEEGVSGCDRADGVSTGKSLMMILKISAPPPYPRQIGADPPPVAKLRAAATSRRARGVKTLECERR
jgi:hypothetical protein